jgi:predicted component of type VI protein secretion system
MSDQEMRDRLIRLETIIGDENRGLLAELQAVKKSVDELKAFQLRAMGAFGVVAVAAQVIIQLVLK